MGERNTKDPEGLGGAKTEKNMRNFNSGRGNSKHRDLLADCNLGLMKIYLSLFPQDKMIWTFVKNYEFLRTTSQMEYMG